MTKLTTQEEKRLTVLRDRLIDEQGDYKPEADFEELQELARLEAKADGQPEPKALPEKQAKPKETPRFIRGDQAKQYGIEPAKRVPKPVKPWLNRGMTYFGVDEHGQYIMWNDDEEQFYQLNNDPMFVDALGHGLEIEYLKSLR